MCHLSVSSKLYYSSVAQMKNYFDFPSCGFFKSLIARIPIRVITMAELNNNTKCFFKANLIIDICYINNITQIQKNLSHRTH